MPGGYRKVGDLPALIPVFPLDGAILLPGCQLPLQIFEPRYLNMIDDAMSGARLIGMIQTQGGNRAFPTLAEVGCAGRITAYAETGDGRYMITLTGVCRFGAGEELEINTPYRQVRPDFEAWAPDLDADEEVVALDRAPFLAALKKYLDHKGMAVEWDAAKTAPAGALINSLAMGLPLEPAEKQALLVARTLNERAQMLAAVLAIDPAEDDDDPRALQ
jgi:Lon protease-like protein